GLISATADLISTELGARTAALVKSAERLIGGLVILVTVALLLGFFIVRGLTRRVGKFYGTLQRIKTGDTAARANVTANDEIGELAQQFDQMMDERESVAERIRIENDQLNNSIVNLLGAAGRLSNKDLTVRAP